LPYFTRRDGACVERAADGPFTTVLCPGNAHRPVRSRCMANRFGWPQISWARLAAKSLAQQSSAPLIMLKKL